jgi:hypothetical protein
MKKGKRPNNDLQNTTRKTKDQATQTPLLSRCHFCIEEFEVFQGIVWWIITLANLFY